MKGKRSTRVVLAILSCLAAPGAMAQPAPSGGLDVQVRLDDFVESYSASKTSLAFLIRDIGFGYEFSGAGRGALGSEKFSQSRKDVDQAITIGKEPRGIIIQKGPDDQPILRIRITGQKADVVVRAKFIRSTWSMLTEGRTVTIIAPVAELQVLPFVLDQLGDAIGREVVGQMEGFKGARMEPLQLRTRRTDGDQVIIQGNNRGFTISYPSITATYSTELKALP
ncbi:MAG: hypothetical protein AB7O49_17365 [Sphingomonadales bacterium]